MAAIEHLALYCADIERSREYYARFFGARSGARYENAAKGFSSYFLSFESGARLEIMSLAQLPKAAPPAPAFGLAHLAFRVGSESAVDELTRQIAAAGYDVYSAPRRTGDGYYESCVADPDSVRVEITV